MSNIPSSDSQIESKICKTDEEAINSEAFYKGFSLCLKKMENLENKEAYLQILAKIKSGTEPVSYDEYNSLEKLLKNNNFISIANEIFNKSVNFSGTKEEYDNFKLDIDSMKKYLLNTVYTSLIVNKTANIIGENTNKENKLKPEFENEFIEVYKNPNNIGEKNTYSIRNKSTGKIIEYTNIDLIYGFLVVKNEKGNQNLLNKKGEMIFDNINILWDGIKFKQIGGGLVIITAGNNKNILGNENGEQISEKGKFYTRFNDLDMINLGFITAKNIDKTVALISKDGSEISAQDGDVYADIYLNDLEKHGIITADIKGKGRILLNDKGEKISEEGKFYDFLHKMNNGLIMGESAELYSLLNSEGKEISSSYYNGIIETSVGLIIGLRSVENKKVSDNIGLLLNNEGKEISNTLYNLRGTYDRYAIETGLLKLFNETSGNWALVNKNGDEVDTINNPLNYSFDEEKNQFYKEEEKSGIKGLFGGKEKIYIPNAN